MPTTEHTINDAMAALLRSGRRAWRASGVVRSETTGMLTGSAKRPDILVLEPYVSPVAIETEISPAQTVEPDARSRLGANIGHSGRTILSSIAVKLPRRLTNLDGVELQQQVARTTNLEMALFTGESPSHALRWPHDHWISGGVADLSLLAQAASVPPDVVDRAADDLVAGVRAAAGLLGEAARSHPGAIEKISFELRQENGEQTWRMAATILASAILFHENLAGGPGDLRDVLGLNQLRSLDKLTKTGLLAEWRKVLKVNFWSIFDIARRILEFVPSVISNPLVSIMADTSDKLLQHNLIKSHDLTGAVFQRLIADRKFLAAYYTTPASAALLAGLAIHQRSTPSGAAWGDVEALQHLRIADFACGTGTLLSAAYQRAAQLHELVGGDAKTLHAHMMGGLLVGCDVLPAAAHLTAATLASAHPTEKYAHSSIMTLAYGRRKDGSIALGSIDLLDIQRRFEILAITAEAAEGTGASIRDLWASIPHYGFDLVMMNPPFTRPTGHEGKKIGVHNPMFAAFQADTKTQRQMGQITADLVAGTSAHGNAGEASIFLVLADRKLKQSGTLALVLPISFMLGEAWSESRKLIANRYSDLILVTNAGVGGGDLSFSADTDIGECLLVGRKDIEGSKRAAFVTLNERPDSTLAGTHIAARIRDLKASGHLRTLEGGPAGGTPVLLGSELVGSAVDAPLASGWNLARVRDASLAQTAYQLMKGKVWPAGVRRAEAIAIQVTEIGKIAQIGPYHADINGRTAAGGIRGPFDIVPISDGSAPSYPVLWSHEAARERAILFEADSEGIPVLAGTPDDQVIIDEKVSSIYSTASYVHFNRDFRFNSQSTSMQITNRKTIGGRAWLSLNLASKRHEIALALWSNTTLGLLLYWWHANKQQSGRGSIAKIALDTMTTLDVNILTGRQIERSQEIFMEMRKTELMPVHLLVSDEGRHRLDTMFLGDIVGVPRDWFVADGPIALLRAKLAAEPSIVGQK